jgi:dihydroorotase
MAALGMTLWRKAVDLIITKPDDWHHHLRDGEALLTTVPAVAKQFGRAIIMPNLNPPVTSADEASAYRQRILKVLPKGCQFTPLMTLYLTEQTTPQIIHEAKGMGIVYACKLYPAGATTHSQFGVRNLETIYPVLEAMAERTINLPLLIHGESIAPEVDVFDREQRFIEETLAPLSLRFPTLRMVLEHITTKTAVDFIKGAPKTLAATITAHHLLLNRNDLLVNGIKPHYYCLPILKSHSNQLALIEAAISGNPQFFLGTDSAPHPREAKEGPCGCAGIYTGHAAIELYATIFEQAGAIDKLEGFASHYGADFYQLSRNTQTIRLIKAPWQIPSTLPLGDSEVIPFWAGKMLAWRISD